MARQRNLDNLRTEKKGMDVLMSADAGFYIPTAEEKRKLYSLLGIEYKRYSRSVDCIQLLVPRIEDVTNQDDFNLIEVKTTRSSSVKELPFGVFFGITENEESLFRQVGNYRLCIIHIVLKSYYTMGVRLQRS